MAASLPGMTRIYGDPVATKPFSSISTKPLISRKIILLATATITDENLFSNGLFQNVFLLYRMFDAMGYAPILIVNEKPKKLSNIPAGLRACRTIATEDIIKQPMPILALIEIGMSIDPVVRRFIKMIGGKLCKLYLGNILNIDIETPIFYPSMHFAHHVVGNIDRIWVSPHYGQHAEYASYINHVVPPEDLNDMIAPYVWDPCILTKDWEQNLCWRPRQEGEEETIVIMEPNISIQKSAHLPLLILETWYRRNPGWKGRIIVVNGERIEMIPHFRENIMPTLKIFKDGLVKMEGRSDIFGVLKNNPSATFMLGQLNNEFNYMTLELMWAGFPVIHNALVWGDFGYSYKGADLEAGAARIDEIRGLHAERLETYKGHARLLAWRYSPYNPEVQARWERLLAI